MPAFGDILTDDEIVSVLEFLKSTWGPEERAFQWQVTMDRTTANGELAVPLWAGGVSSVGLRDVGSVRIGMPARLPLA